MALRWLICSDTDTTIYRCSLIIGFYCVWVCPSVSDAIRHFADDGEDMFYQNQNIAQFLNHM